jgi:ubiquinone biosynthesis protein UbiJ
MSGEIDGLVLEHLRHIRSAVDSIAHKMTELTFRVGMLESNMAGLQGQYAHVANRIDRVDERLERIERRIGLIDA